MCPGQRPLSESMIAAKEEVMTTRFTVGAEALIAFRMPVVPIMAFEKVS